MDLEGQAEAIAALPRFQILLVVGSSARGKTQLLKQLERRKMVAIKANHPSLPADRPIVSVLAELLGGQNEAMDRLSAVGISSVPAWLQPFHTLSNGMQAMSSPLRLYHRGQLVTFGLHM